jgi:hypothetical protein
MQKVVRPYLSRQSPLQSSSNDGTNLPKENEIHEGIPMNLYAKYGRRSCIVPAQAPIGTTRSSESRRLKPNPAMIIGTNVEMVLQKISFVS